MSYTDNPTEALGHSYVASIIEATCTERGYTIYTCTKCGDSYRDNETAAKGHNYVSEVVSATCTEGGGTVYTCTRCGESYHGSETGALGHAYETNTVAATCTEEDIPFTPVQGAEVFTRTTKHSRSVITM